MPVGANQSALVDDATAADMMYHLLLRKEHPNADHTLPRNLPPPTVDREVVVRAHERRDCEDAPAHCPVEVIHELLVDGDRVVVLQEGERLRLPKRDLDPEALSLPEVCV
jgi:hypothetical protein